jgi:hypothetical protein
VVEGWSGGGLEWWRVGVVEGWSLGRVVILARRDRAGKLQWADLESGNFRSAIQLLLCKAHRRSNQSHV